MPHVRQHAALTILLILLPVGAAAQDGEAAATAQDAPHTDDVSHVDPVSEQGQRARGLYFSAPAVRALGADGVVGVVRGARMTAAVIDLKDERGHVSYDTRIEALQPSKKRYYGNASALIRRLKDAGIYVIGRIVCFSDPILPRAEPDRAVLDGRPRKEGRLWADWGGRNTWLDPYNPKNHELIVAIAKEAELLGVDEIQLDYIRFPVDEATSFAVFPAETETPRHEVLLEALAQIDRAVRLPLGVDVFGLTTMPWARPEALGQVPRLWAKHVEVFSPMLYLNGMRAWHADDPERRAERLVALGVATLRERIGPGPVIRPFLQGFPQGADHYDPAFIAEQIRGARRAGGDGFLFWHPGSRYGMVRQAATGVARRLLWFPIDERAAWRKRTWGTPAQSDSARAALESR